MRPYVIEVGEMKVEIYGGYKEIGGNCIVVERSGEKIVFDNGISFATLRRFYRGRVQPIGPVELRAVGAIPPAEVYEGADVVYISHLHLDHLGLLGVVGSDLTVCVPSKAVLEVVESWYRNSPTWLAYVPHGLEVELCEPLPFQRDSMGVTPIPVSHSAYPAYAYLLEGRDGFIFYSGDLRLVSPLGAGLDSLSNIGRVLAGLAPEVALIEGTNFGDVEVPIGPDQFRSMLTSIMLESGLVAVSVDPLDYELFFSVLELARLGGRRVVVSSDRLIDVLPIWARQTDELSEVEVLIDVERSPSLPVRWTTWDEVLSSPESYVLLQEPLGFLEGLRRMKLWGRSLPAATTAVLTSPEPRDEGEMEEETLVYWLSHLGVQVYRLRVSGHYYPFQFSKLINIVNPKRLVPIHTRNPQMMLNMARRGG